MSLYKVMVEFIDLRSFSNVWYWIALCAIWTKAIGCGLGVPYHLVRAARRGSAPALQDLEYFARITTARMLSISRALGPWLVGLVSFTITVLGLLGFVYQSGLAQAVMFLWLPLCVLGYLSLAAALRVEGPEGRGEALIALLTGHRRTVQLLAIVSTGATVLLSLYVHAQLFKPW